MKILCVSYREWALNIYENISKKPEHEFLIIHDHESYSDELVDKFSPDLILFYGWSWLVSKEIINNYQCVMLHPSPLPKYRGGSPIQNQIINNEKVDDIDLATNLKPNEICEALKKKNITYFRLLVQKLYRYKTSSLLS